MGELNEAVGWLCMHLQDFRRAAEGRADASLMGSLEDLIRRVDAGPSIQLVEVAQLSLLLGGPSANPFRNLPGVGPGLPVTEVYTCPGSRCPRKAKRLDSGAKPVCHLSNAMMDVRFEDL